MGTPRARKSTATTSAGSAGVVKAAARARTRPRRPDSMLHPVDDKGIRMPVKPDTRAPVRPISVRAPITVGEKTV